MGTRAANLVIIGRVQGVGYRAWAAEEAHKRGLAGWVMNHRDGTVEALFSGDDAEVELMIAACWKGPLGTRVDDIEISPGPEPSGLGFLVLPTD
jgi:acylphosphatase